MSEPFFPQLKRIMSSGTKGLCLGKQPGAFETLLVQQFSAIQWQSLEDKCKKVYCKEPLVWTEYLFKKFSFPVNVERHSDYPWRTSKRTLQHLVRNKILSTISHLTFINVL